MEVDPGEVGLGARIGFWLLSPPFEGFYDSPNPHSYIFREPVGVILDQFG
jgi:hypothetical protein